MQLNVVKSVVMLVGPRWNCNCAEFKFLKSDKDVISNIRQYLGLHDVAVLCKERHERFLKRTSLLRHTVFCSLTA